MYILDIISSFFTPRGEANVLMFNPQQMKCKDGIFMSASNFCSHSHLHNAGIAKVLVPLLLPGDFKFKLEQVSMLLSILMSVAHVRCLSEGHIAWVLGISLGAVHCRG